MAATNDRAFIHNCENFSLNKLNSAEFKRVVDILN